ncbi:conjugal transfer protein TraI [Pedobacter aquatilis]|uniref:conjugal transfer protein TraI n=1 Tax=Pedobacter aquatilis TaxID=351343 RepID=UPI00293019D6|nr:conjugal transfer protein TraI [Pedobacter aquatilis]
MKRLLGAWTKVRAKMKRLMKNYMIILPVSAMTLCVSLPKGAQAQLAVLEVIKAGVKKVIKAVDLKVQRLQNETIWLQNAQKVLENQLSKLKLTEIAEWTGRQKELYEKYYRELWEVKSAIIYFKRIRELTGKQMRLVDEYQWALGLFSKDKHFSREELEAMKTVYQGILEESLKSVDEILLVVNSFKTQMSDGERLELISKASQRLDENYTDLQKFNRSQMSISVSRAKSNDEVVTLKELYGLE